MNAITIDVDWAPDWCIDRMAAALIENGVKATWFLTHDSPACRMLSRHPRLFELGAHPNFLEGSSHGRSPRDVMAYVKSLVPDAVSVRTHGLVQSSALLRMMREEYSIRYDASLLLPGAAYVEPHRLFFPGGSYMVRVPYCWEDDTAMYSGSGFDHIPAGSGGIRAYDFHPVLVALNLNAIEQYERCKREHPSLIALTEKDSVRYARQGAGAGTLFMSLVKSLSKDGGHYMIKEIAAGWDARQGLHSP